MLESFSKNKKFIDENDIIRLKRFLCKGLNPKTFKDFIELSNIKDDSINEMITSIRNNLSKVIYLNKQNKTFNDNLNKIIKIIYDEKTVDPDKILNELMIKE